MGAACPPPVGVASGSVGITSWLPPADDDVCPVMTARRSQGVASRAAAYPAAEYRQPSAPVTVCWCLPWSLPFSMSSYSVLFIIIELFTRLISQLDTYFISFGKESPL